MNNVELYTEIENKMLTMLEELGGFVERIEFNDQAVERRIINKVLADARYEGQAGDEGFFTIQAEVRASKTYYNFD